MKVGPLEFGIAEFERVRERREAAIQDELGDRYDPRAMRETLDNLAARELVESGLLALAAEDLGLQVTTREIERLVLADPGFRNEEGKFDREQFEKYTQYVYGSQKAFMADRRLALLSMKMLSLLQSQPEVSEGEAREAARRDLEEVQIAFATLDAGPGDPPEIAADAIAAAIAGRAEEIAKIYQEKGEEYNRPERVRARHILRTVAQRRLRTRRSNACAARSRPPRSGSRRESRSSTWPPRSRRTPARRSAAAISGSSRAARW